MTHLNLRSTFKAARMLDVMPWQMSTLLALAFFCYIAPVQAASSPLLLSQDRLLALRQQPSDWRSLQQACDKELAQQATPVKEYAPENHYRPVDKNPSQEKDATKSQGTSARLSSDGWTVYRAGLCYLLSQDLRYAQHAQAMIDAWSQTLRTVSKGQGHADISANLPQFILAASWVRRANQWDDRAFKDFLSRVILPASTSDKSNNHGNWGVLLDICIAAYLNDEARLNLAQQRWMALLESQVAADGSLPQEICRSATSNWCGGADKGIKGLTYTHYALAPAALAAEVLLSLGRDVYQTAAGEKLSRAYRQAAIWTRYPETFPYYASNKGRLIDVKNAAYFALLQRHYPHPEGAAVLAQGGLGFNGYQFLLLFQK